MNNIYFMLTFAFIGGGLVSCQERTVIHGSDMSRVEEIGFITHITTEDMVSNILFDSIESYRDFQIHTGNITFPATRIKAYLSSPPLLHSETEGMAP